MSCGQCGDGISYPNKFVRRVVEQAAKLNGGAFSVLSEHVFSWSADYDAEDKIYSGKKLYDIYIPEIEVIIENHGEQHYTNKEHFANRKHPDYRISTNDIVKRNAAIGNGILPDHYVVIDCSQSNQDYIKRSIMNSALPSLLQFSEDDIDWKQCAQSASSSALVTACNHWNAGIKSAYKIAALMGISHSTVSGYIRKGMACGMISD